MQNTDKLGRDGFYIQKYKLHVMKPIYPNKDLDFKEQKEDLRRRDCWMELISLYYAELRFS